MPLSGILASVPKYQTILPVSGRKVDYRPFIVKEEKVLLMAAESKDEKTINSAIREVILACTNNTVDPLNIPITDMEYLFLQLRSNSVGESVKPNIKCSKCEMPTEVQIPINDIKPKMNPNHKKVIHLIKDISLQMKYPTMESIQSIGGENDLEKTFNLLVFCIEKVINGEEIINTSELDPGEVRTFIEEMTQDQFKKVLQFLDTMPKLEYEVNFKCKHCGTDNNTMMRGITSFFS
jgi:hypothetical protein